MTLKTGWKLGELSLGFVLFPFMAAACAFEAHKGWQAARWQHMRWLVMSQSLISAGSVLILANRCTDMAEVANAFRPSQGVHDYVFNFTFGVGVFLVILGFAVFPMIWLEVGLKSRWFQLVHRRLRLTRRALSAFLVLFLVLFTGSLIAVSLAPGQTSMVFIAIGALCLMVNIAVNMAGSRLVTVALVESRFSDVSVHTDTSRGAGRGNAAAVDVRGEIRALATGQILCCGLMLLCLAVAAVGDAVQSPPTFFVSLAVTYCLAAVNACRCVLYTQQVRRKEHDLRSHPSGLSTAEVEDSQVEVMTGRRLSRGATTSGVSSPRRSSDVDGLACDHFRDAPSSPSRSSVECANARPRGH